jgi:hypothetical protein
MRRCWRSWRHTRWKLSPLCSSWRTNVPGLQRVMHGTLPPQGGPAQTGGSSVAAPGCGKKKNKKNRSMNRPQAGAPVAAAAAARGQNSRGKHPRQQRTDLGSCPVHPGARHSAIECHEIQKLAERLSKRRDQASKDGSSPPRRSGKEKVSDADAAAAERELGYQTPKKDLKGLFHQSDSESGGTSAAKSCTSCTVAAQSSSPGGTSKPIAEKFSR